MFRNKRIKKGYFFYSILAFSFLMLIFTIFNLFFLFSLKKNLKELMAKNSVDVIRTSKNISTSSFQSTNKLPENNNQSFITPGDKKYYYNLTADPFSSNNLINQKETNMYLDQNVTALTFKPLYSLTKTNDYRNNSTDYSGIFKEVGGKIYYYDKEVSLPVELKNKKNARYSFNKLEKKWLLAAIFKDGEQETAVVYLFDGLNFELLSEMKFKTKYPYGGASISAAGSDDQFMVFYSGYEGVAYLYNNGSIQNISDFFGLRVLNGGFKARILKSGNSDLATWYICSDTEDKPKLIKLWQNNTSKIQGILDLSHILEGETAFCDLRGSHQLQILIDGKPFIFKDLGFDNKVDYVYQSTNLSDFKEKNIVKVELQSYNLNAADNSYKIFVSNNLSNWQEGQIVDFLELGNLSETFYFRFNFKAQMEAYYSPWFDGLNLISYSGEEDNN